MTLKVLTLVGTRPEIIKLSRVIPALDAHTDHLLVHSGQNYDYELNEIFFQEMEIRRPDRFLEAARPTAAETIGEVIARIDRLLEETRPDAFLILGDTNSCLGCLAAKRRHIPVFHMEAGNRCFDDRVPEEVNRRVIDHASDINLPYSAIAREYLLREGIAPDRVIKTGSPVFEVLEHYRPRIDASDVLSRLGLSEGDYYVVSAHREENVDSPEKLRRLVDILNRLATETRRRIIFSAHPRTRKRLEAAGLGLHEKVQAMKPLGFFDYVHLQLHAAATLSDSGTITEESSLLNFPALNLREAHERPEGMEEGSVMMTGLDPDRIFEGLDILARQPRGRERLLRPVEDYLMPNVSAKVLRILESYTDYVGRKLYGDKASS